MVRYNAGIPEGGSIMVYLILVVMFLILGVSAPDAAPVIFGLIGVMTIGLFLGAFDME